MIDASHGSALHVCDVCGSRTLTANRSAAELAAAAHLERCLPHADPDDRRHHQKLRNTQARRRSRRDTP